MGSYISQDPIGLVGGNPTLYGYVNNNNEYVDPYGLSRLPRTDGEWTGEAGNGTWTSNNSKVNGVTGGAGIEFKNGYPDFSPYSQGNYDFTDLDGTSGDFDKVYERLKNEKGLKSKNAAKNWLKDQGLTPHHHQNGKIIQLIPTDLHGNVPHEGGASKLRNKTKGH